MTEPKRHPTDVHVGNQLRMRRLATGMTQERLGTLIGRTFQQIQKYERGINRVSASVLFDLANLLGVDVSFFFEGLEGDTTTTQPMDPAVAEFIGSHEGFKHISHFVKLGQDMRAIITRLIVEAAPKPKGGARDRS